jgi:sec-independent protein translocase protein TatB
MFDIGWSELLVIGVVTLLVVGPRDLPQMLKTLGVWTGRARAMAREFQSGVNDMIRESELDQIRRDAEKAAKDFENEARAIDPTPELQQAMDIGPLEPIEPGHAHASEAADVPAAIAPVPAESAPPTNKA